MEETTDEAKAEAEAPAKEEPKPETFIHEGQERRREYRLNKVLGAELGSGDELVKARIFVVNISRSGLKATNQTRIPETEDQTLKLYISAKEPPIEVWARIAWQKELPLSGLFEIGFEFMNIADEDAERLEHFIEAERKRLDPKPTLDLSSPWKFGRVD